MVELRSVIFRQSARFGELLNMKIHFGVLDVPEPESNKTTYEVAKILEEKYDLFSIFAYSHETKIVKYLEEEIAQSLETAAESGKIKGLFKKSSAKIEKDFHRFLESEEITKFPVRGVPTKAALRGKSIRFKRRIGPRRPSFIDSGVLESSFRSWVEI